MAHETMIKIGVGLAALAVVIMIMFTALNKGKNMATAGLSKIDSVSDSLNDAEFDVYLNRNVTGSDVVGLIKTTYNNVDVEIVVSTKDGALLCYNSATGVFSGLTGSPDKDAAGNAFGTPIEATATKTSVGYNNAASASTAGYIYTSGKFYGTAQYDANGSLRRVTFVQQ